MELKIGALAFTLFLLTTALIAQEGATGFYPHFKYTAGISSSQDAVVTGSRVVAFGEIYRAKSENRDSGTEDFKVVMSLIGPNEDLGLATSPNEHAGDEQVRFISLNPGESEKLEMKFAAKEAGQNTLRILLYRLYSAQGCVSSERDECTKTKQELVTWGVAYVRVHPAAEPIEPIVAPTLKFASGWNMVSVPTHTKVSMAEIASACGTRDHAWRHVPGKGYERSTALEPGVGYWVKAARDCAYGMKQGLREAKPEFSRKLSAGWNMVAGPLSALGMDGNAGDCKIESGPWHYSSSAYSYAGTIEPGRAYWVKVSSACTLGGNEVPPSPPS